MSQAIQKAKLELLENKLISKLSEDYPVEELLSFNEYNVNEKLEQNAYWVEQFRLLYIHEKQKLRRIEANLAEATGQRYDHYKYKDDRGLKKIEIERYYLPMDEELIKLKKLIQLQEIKVSFFETVAEAFKTQGFNMRNFIENLKIGG